jgi:hypothetical protein
MVLLETRRIFSTHDHLTTDFALDRYILYFHQLQIYWDGLPDSRSLTVTRATCASFVDLADRNES